MTKTTMKQDIHPEYRPAVFIDIPTGTRFLTKTTVTSKEKETAEDGTELQVIKLDITSASHPFYTGKKTIVDTAGRVDRFNQRRGAAQGATAARSGRR